MKADLSGSMWSVVPVCDKEGHALARDALEAHDWVRRRIVQEGEDHLGKIDGVNTLRLPRCAWCGGTPTPHFVRGRGICAWGRVNSNISARCIRIRVTGVRFTCATVHSPIRLPFIVKLVPGVVRIMFCRSGECPRNWCWTRLGIRRLSRCLGRVRAVSGGGGVRAHSWGGISR